VAFDWSPEELGNPTAGQAPLGGSREGLRALDTEVVRTVVGRYGRIGFLANDIGAARRSLELYGEWAENELGFVRQFIQAGSVVLDVGAYIGTHTLAFASFVGAEGSVVAFEPQPKIFELLKENVSANDLSNVRLENAAVAASAGSMETPSLDITKPTSFGSTSFRDRPVKERAMSAHEAAHAKAPEVPVITIDGLALTTCSLIKIDAEGMESSVIRGAADTIRRLTPVIYAECNSVADGLNSLKQLRELGYGVRLHVVDAFTPDNFFGVSENIFGGAREAALVGVPAHQIDSLGAHPIRSCELLARVDNADDLVLGLLNKPQYAEEILRPSAAASSGAVAWLDEAQATRERLADEINRVKGAIAEERARGEQVVQAFADELRATRERLREVEQKLEIYRNETANQAAAFEAAMRQAQFARDIADQAEREKELVQSQLLTRIDVLMEQLLQRERELNSVYASTSWRLTGPVRAAVNWIRR
jgi:FkbM family methyltransferase